MKNKTVYTCTDSCGNVRYSCDPNDLDDRYAVGPGGTPARRFKSRTLYRHTYWRFLVSCLSPGFRLDRHNQRFVRADGGFASWCPAADAVFIADDAEAALNWLVNE